MHQPGNATSHNSGERSTLCRAGPSRVHLASSSRPPDSAVVWQVSQGTDRRSPGLAVAGVYSFPDLMCACFLLANARSYLAHRGYCFPSLARIAGTSAFLPYMMSSTATLPNYFPTLGKLAGAETKCTGLSCKTETVKLLN